MTKHNLESLRQLRADKRQQFPGRKVVENTIQVIVGMGTCGIAAGAKDALNMFVGETRERKMKNVVVKQTGCMGLCQTEPTVEVRMKGMPNVLYGNVDAQVAKKIIELHLVQGRLVDEHVFDYPSRDICEE